MSVIQGDYSRKQESKADKFGLKIVFDQYGTTEGSDRLFQFLKEQQEAPKWVNMFSTHPAPEDRIKNLREYGEELGVEPEPGAGH
ncbi:hypothetical protein NBRC116493_22200 [Aurantivibrio infirmus]